MAFALVTAMAKYKHPGRTKRQPRDPGPDRRKRASWAPSDDLFEDSDGVIDRDLEFDTNKYSIPLSREE